MTISEKEFFRSLNEHGEILARKQSIDLREAKKRIVRLINSKRLNELQPGTLLFQVVTDAYLATPSNQPIPTDAEYLSTKL